MKLFREWNGNSRLSGFWERAIRAGCSVPCPSKRPPSNKGSVTAAERRRKSRRWISVVAGSDIGGLRGLRGFARGAQLARGAGASARFHAQRHQHQQHAGTAEQQDGKK